MSDTTTALTRMESTRDRIETLLERQQEMLTKDYARVGLILGGGMVVAAVVLMVAGLPFAFSLTGMVWGAIMTVTSLVLRHLGRRRQIEHARVLADLHERTVRLAQRTEILGRLWAEGLPPRCSIGDVLVLLDAQMTAPHPRT